MHLIEPNQLSRVTVLGTGTIGAGWASHFLGRGMTVAAYDPAGGYETKLRDFVERSWQTILRLGARGEFDPAKLQCFDDPADASREAQFVQECAPERLETKVALFEQIESALPDDAVVASSTSGFLMSELQEGRRGPHRYVVGHPVNPPHIIPLVEVVGGRQTDPEVVDWTVQFYRTHGKYPIRIKKEVPGHLLNRLQTALFREAVHVVDEGIASVADVDATLTEGLGLRWALTGPLLTVHLSGGEGGLRHQLQHLGPSIESWWADLGSPQLTPEVRARLVAGTDSEIAGRSFTDLVQERDALLVDMLESIAAGRAGGAP